jgi:hypothetical protein
MLGERHHGSLLDRASQKVLHGLNIANGRLCTHDLGREGRDQLTKPPALARQGLRGLGAHQLRPLMAGTKSLAAIVGRPEFWREVPRSPYIAGVVKPANQRIELVEAQEVFDEPGKGAVLLWISVLIDLQ